MSLLAICKILRLFVNKVTAYDKYSLLLSCKMSLLALCKILRLFVNKVTADDKYSLLNRDNLTQSIQMQLSQKQILFSEFFSQHLKSSLNFEHFQKKMNLIADVFPNFRTPKNVVSSVSKKSRFRELFQKQHVKCVETVFKCEQQQFYHIYWSMWRQLTYKKFLVVMWQILRLFVTTVTAADKSSLLNPNCLMQPIQMQLSQKQKTFSEFLFQFLKSSLNFEHFQRKDDPHSWCILEIRTPKNVVRSISKKSCFRGPSENQDGKQAQTLLKFERQHLYHIYWWLWGKLSWKKSLLEISKNLRLFVNTLTADDKYSLLNRDNST